MSNKLSLPRTSSPELALHQLTYAWDQKVYSLFKPYSSLDGYAHFLGSLIKNGPNSENMYFKFTAVSTELDYWNVSERRPYSIEEFIQLNIVQRSNQLQSIINSILTLLESLAAQRRITKLIHLLNTPSNYQIGSYLRVHSSAKYIEYLLEGDFALLNPQRIEALSDVGALQTDAFLVTDGTSVQAYKKYDVARPYFFDLSADATFEADDSEDVVVKPSGEFTLTVGTGHTGASISFIGQLFNVTMTGDTVTIDGNNSTTFSGKRTYIYDVPNSDWKIACPFNAGEGA